MSHERLYKVERPSILPMSSNVFNRSRFSSSASSPSSGLNNNGGDRKYKRSTSYDEWAMSYEWDLLDLGYRLHDIAANLLMENVDKRHNDCHIIDVGCGTGFLGRSLRQKEFNGVIHGIDENETMLRHAERKNAYDDLFWQHLSPDDKIDVSDVMYDGLACIASFGVEHIHPKMLPLLVERVKTEGVIVVTAANHPRDETDKSLLEQEVDKLIQSDIVYELAQTKECYFSRGVSSRTTENTATCQLYCFIKN